MSIFDLPAGATDASPLWQSGYDDGHNEVPPAQLDPVYVSGWCHGYCGAFQSSEAEAVAAFNARSGGGKGSGMSEDMGRLRDAVVKALPSRRFDDDDADAIIRAVLNELSELEGGPRYLAGDWSRRNVEAMRADLLASEG